MNRRNWIKSAVASSSLFLGADSHAELACLDFAPGQRQCQAGINSALLHISATKANTKQEQSQWCWAACISMVFSYYGHPVSQARIVMETWGKIRNLPGQPADILRNLNRPWTDDAGEDFTVSSGPGSTNPPTAAQDLANDMPLIIGTQGHAVVLTALTYSTRSYGVDVDAATVRDPWPGRGRRVLSPSEWYGIMFAAQIRVND